MKKLRVIVTGGGIGGLSLALSLHQAGIPVRIYEAVRDPRTLARADTVKLTNSTVNVQRR